MLFKVKKTSNYLLWVLLTCSLVQEICKNTAQDCLVTNHQNVLLSLQLHDHRLQPLNQVFIWLNEVRRSVTLSTVFKTQTTKKQLKKSLKNKFYAHLSFRIAVPVFVLVSQGKLQRVTLLDFLVHHLLTHALWKERRKHVQHLRKCFHRGFCTEVRKTWSGHTASISLRDFHCSYDTPRISAVWIVLFIWLVHTLRFLMFCSWRKFLRRLANWTAREHHRRMH